MGKGTSTHTTTPIHTPPHTFTRPSTHQHSPSNTHTTHTHLAPDRPLRKWPGDAGLGIGFRVRGLGTIEGTEGTKYSIIIIIIISLLNFYALYWLGFIVPFVCVRTKVHICDFVLRI